MSVTPADDLARLEAGLDALDSNPVVGPSRRRRAWAVTWPPLAFLAVLLGLWALTARSVAGLPAPTDVERVLAVQLRDGVLLSAIGTSVSRGVLGFVVAVLLGTPLGLLLSRVRLLRRALAPFLLALQSLPSVAWVPATVLLLGTGRAALYAVVLAGSVPSVAMGTVNGLAQVPPLIARVGRVLGARGLTAARHVLLPAALPGYLIGLRQAWAFSWRGLMAAELIVQAGDLGTGLGQLLNAAKVAKNTSAVFAGILGILLVGIVVELGLFAPLERAVLRRRGLTGAG